uniref:Ig-like domain-containing protein n=1 Tax=Chrysemys picta bellii TaxID=8478 RepID=A0A8C3HAL1_CHRPI
SPCVIVYSLSGTTSHSSSQGTQFTVTGPDHPVIASLGGEAVLSCHLSPRISTENMEVRWFRSKYSEVVHLYRDGRDQYREQMPEYGGRTELLKDNITNGRVSLRIRNIQPSDNGQYTCYFESSVYYEAALLELQVAGLGSDPDISVEGHQDGGIRVVCRSSRWYPEPEAQWRDHQGQILPSASKEITPEANGLFQTEIAIVITEESNEKLSCCVRNPRLDQERESAISLLQTSQFTVTGPDHPITTSIGGEAVLPCHLSPRMSAENMEVRWFRFQYHSVVHLYQEGQDKYEEQMLEYHGRTELLKDGITNGSVSLRLCQVQLSDHGQYTCFFQYSISYEEAILELMVSAMGSDPHISVDGHQDGGIRVVCQSAGWHPEPEAQWRDHHGQLLSSASEKISKADNGLFQTQISIVITEDSNQNLSCSVRNPLVNQDKISTVFIAGQCLSTLHWGLTRHYRC